MAIICEEREAAVAVQVTAFDPLPRGSVAVALAREPLMEAEAIPVRVGIRALPGGRFAPQRIGLRIYPSRPSQIAKRGFDLVGAVLLLLLLLPVFACCMLLIWLEDGRPIVFAQWRTGRAGRRFRMFKFRTMVRNAEELKARYAHLNELTWPDFKITNDPRITRVGRFLRRTSLDELPQLWNVIRGDMSLVGPRPTSFAAGTYALWQTERLEVRPGITGLWQISGRSDVDFNDRLKLDIDYIERASLWLDLQILLRTVAVVFTRRGAY